MKAKQFSYIIAATLFSIGGYAYAESWSLDSCISYAVANNLTVKQREISIKEGEQGITEAKDRFLPSLDASASQTFNFGRGLTSQNTYADRNTSNFGWSAGMSLPIFQGMTEYRNLSLSKIVLKQYLLENEAAKDNVTLNVISQYLQVLYAKEILETAKSQAELSEFQVNRQKALIEAGKVAEATLYDMEALASQDRLQIVVAENDVNTSLINLASLLQLTDTRNFDVSSLNEGDPAIPDTLEVYGKALKINNSLAAARESVNAAKKRIEVAKSGYIPTLRFNAGLGSSYYKIGGFDNDAFAAQMRHNFATYLGFSLNIPIFDGFNTRNNIRRAKLQKTTALLDLEQREYDLFKEIRLAYIQATGAREKYYTTEKTLEKTRLSFDSTSERFNLGRATQADYEQAKNNLYKTEINLIQSRYEYLMRYKILMFYKNGRTE